MNSGFSSFSIGIDCAMDKSVALGRIVVKTVFRAPALCFDDIFLRTHEFSRAHLRHYPGGEDGDE